MKIENLSVKSFEKHTTETDEGTANKYVATLEKEGYKVKITFDDKPEQVFIPTDKFSISLSNPQKQLLEKDDSKAKN